MLTHNKIFRMQPNPEADMRQFFEKILKEKQEECLVLLRNSLMETDWKQNISNMCRGLILEQGLDRVNQEEVVEKVLPQALAAIPKQIEEEVLHKIKRSLESGLLDQ